MKKLLLLVVLMFIFTVAAHAQEKPQVVASFSILADVARNVAGDAADVSTLIPPNADPHAYTPTPSDLAKVADADLVLVNGALLEEGLLKIIEGALGDKTPVVASSCVGILPFGDSVIPTADADPDVAQRCDAHAAEMNTLREVAGIPPEPASAVPTRRLYQLHCTAEAGERGNCDPHVWFNPYNVALWTLQIRDTLSELDPANAATYQANMLNFIGDLEAVRLGLEEQIATLPEDRRVLVTDHDTLGYFADTYGFQIVGLVVPSVSTVVEPSAAQTAQLIETIRAQGVPAIFVGATVSPTLSQQIADEAGAQVYTLYTESLSEGDPVPTYLDFMRYNVQTIVDALSQEQP